MLQPLVHGTGLLLLPLLPAEPELLLPGPERLLPRLRGTELLLLPLHLPGCELLQPPPPPPWIRTQTSSHAWMPPWIRTQVWTHA